MSKKTNQVHEWRNLPEVELHGKHKELCQQLYALKNERRINKKLEKPHLKSKTRREIARLLTVLNEKRLKNA